MTNQKQDVEIEDEDIEDGVDVTEDKNKDKGKGAEGADQSNEEEDVDDLDVEVTGEETQREKLQKQTRSEERRLKKNRRNKYRQRDQEVIRQQQQVINDLKRGQDELSQRLDAVAGQTDRVTAQNIDDRIHETSRIVDAAKRLHSEAIIAGDAEKASQAMEDFAEARDGLNALKHYKSQLVARKSAPRAEGGPVERSANNPAPGFKDKTIERKFKAWHADNPWYDVRGSASSDPDSRLAYGMDTQLEAEGYDPASDEYWEELDKRLAKKLPHRMSRDDDYEEDEDEEDNQRGRNRMNARDARQEVRKKPATGGSPKNAPNGSRKTITISAERAAAMREMGYQPGTSDWKRMAKKYSDYDKQHA